MWGLSGHGGVCSSAGTGSGLKILGGASAGGAAGGPSPVLGTDAAAFGASQCSALLERPKLAPPAAPSRLRYRAYLMRKSRLLYALQGPASELVVRFAGAHSSYLYLRVPVRFGLCVLPARGPSPRASPPEPTGPQGLPGHLEAAFIPSSKYWAPRVKIWYVADQVFAGAGRVRDDWRDHAARRWARGQRL